MTTPAGNSATVFLQALLQQWGLESLSSVVADMLTAGDSADVIPLKLRDTEAYKVRFKGNLDRIKAGLPALSESEYLATETQLKDVVRRYVGVGAYDTKDNLDKWMTSDVSPQELNDRFGSYRDEYLSRPQAWRDAWAANGLTPADAIQAVMDPSVNETTFKRKTSVWGLSAEAFNAYGDTNSALNVERLGTLADRGVTNADARKAFEDVASREGGEGALARMSGTDLSRTEQEDAALGDAAAGNKRKKVLREEDARFATNYLGAQSALGRSKAGSY